MTKFEFLEKYGDAKVKFSGYYKFCFDFKGELENGGIIVVSCGGSSDDIYKMNVLPNIEETVCGLDPDYGSVSVDGKEIAFFRDF